MFFSYLEKIRNSSPQKKKIFSFGLALFITGFIFIIWLKFWLPVDMEKIKNSGKTFKDEPSITSFFTNSFKDIYSQINDIKKTNFSSTVKYSSQGEN